MCVPGSANLTLVAVPRPLPGVVIFVHGVNSEGEWYANAEDGLTAGLNARLGRRDMLSNDYDVGSRRNLLKLRRSPVIRFYWGYRAPVAETSKRDSKGEIKLKYRIFLKRRDEVPGAPGRYTYDRFSYDYPANNVPGTYYWGGGPFQNGTTALNMSWYDGFDPNFGIIFDAGSPYIMKERDRPLNEAPKRTYFVNASRRLADLIDSIYHQYPHDTVSVVSHSQGTMVALLAMLMVDKVPDALFLCNSPYCFEDKFLDGFAYSSKSPTSGSRVRTFYKVLDRFKQSKELASSKTTEEQLDGVGGWLDEGDLPEQLGRYLTPNGEVDGPTEEMPPPPSGLPEKERMWTPAIPTEEPVPGEEDHHNHGRVFVYCCPHDRVMGSVPLQSIGWKGVDYKLPHPTDPRTKLLPFVDYEGVLYQRQFMRSHSVGSTPDEKDGPQTPRYPKEGEFWMPPQPDKSLGLFYALAVPSKDATIYVNGPRVPEPASIELMESFNLILDDEKKIAGDADYLFTKELIEEKKKWVEEPEDIYTGQRRQRTQTAKEIETEMATTNATPTNHSTIFSHKEGELVRRILAYDLPIGRAQCFEDPKDPDFWLSLIKRADWLNEGSDVAYKEGGDFIPNENDNEPKKFIDIETRDVVREELEHWREMYGGS